MAITWEKVWKVPLLDGLEVSASGLRVGGLEVGSCMEREGPMDAHSLASSARDASYVVASSLTRALKAARLAIVRNEPVRDKPLRTAPSIFFAGAISRLSSDEEGGEGGEVRDGVFGRSSLPFKAISETHRSWTFDTGGGSNGRYFALGFIV